MGAQELLAKFPRFGQGSCLKRMSTLIEQLNGPTALGLKITGSNGKGSTCAMAAQILEAHGLRTGLYTSPHLFRMHERIQINGVSIPNEDLERWLGIVEGHCDQIAPGSFGRFEVLTAVAQGWFTEQGVDAIVWEAGIGGQLDATRVLACQAAVLVNVSLEHTAILGNSLTQIALDKAQIANPDIPLVTGPLPSEVLHAIQAQRQSQRAGATYTAEAVPVDTPMALKGPHQRANAGCAVRACALLLKDSFQVDVAHAALSTARWPGRFQRVQHDGIDFIVDAAHNMAGIHELQRTLTECGLGPPEPLIVVIGVSQDRPYDQMVPALAHCASHVICTQAQHKGTDPNELARYNPGPTECTTSVAEAVSRAKTRARELQAPVLVSGGLFLAAETLCVLENRDTGRLSF